MNLNESRDKAYQCAIDHGWHEEDLSDEHFLCLVISELMEAVEADRKGKYANMTNFNQTIDYYIHDLKLYGDNYNSAFCSIFEYYIKDSVEDELADACIRLLDLAGLRNVDLIFADGLIAGGEYKETKESFTVFMYHLCNLLSLEEETLKNKINYAIAIIICYCDIEKNIDIEWYIDQKMKYNEIRPYKHGNKAY